MSFDTSKSFCFCSF